MTAIRVLLAAIVVAIPNQLHLPEAIVKGVNPLNLLAGLALIAFLRLGPADPPAPPSPLRPAIALLCAALTYAFAVGVWRDASQWVGDLTVLKNALFYPLLSFLVYHAIRDRTTAQIVFAALLGVTALAALEAIREGIDYGGLEFSDTKRAAGPFGPDYKAANLAAVFFCMFYPLFVAVVLFARGRPLLRAAALGGAFLVVLGTFFTYSRQAFVILAVVTALLAGRRSPLLAVIAVVAVLGYQTWAPEAVVERIAMTEQGDDLDYSEEKYDSSTASRFVLWAAAYEMFREHPAGVGLNHFKRHVGQYAPQYTGMDAHNFYVLFLAEGGVVGIALLAAALLSLVAFVLRVGRAARSDEARTMAIGLQMSLLAALLGNLYGSRWLDGAVSGNFWVLAAVVARYVALEAVERRARPTRSADGRLRTSDADRGGEAPAVGAALAGAIASHADGVRPTAAPLGARRGRRAAPPMRDARGRIVGGREG